MTVIKWIGFIVCLAGAGMANAQVPPQPNRPTVELDDAVATDSGAVLKKEQLSALVARANEGDAEAAFRTSRHFSGIGAVDSSHMWLLYAAALGHPVAQYNLYFELRGKQDCKSLIEAYAWLKSATLKGVGNSASLKGGWNAESELDAARVAARGCHIGN